MFQTLGGVAVIGTSTWAVLQGRKKLNVTWDDGPNAGFDSKPQGKLRQTVSKPAKVVRHLGDVDAEFAKAARRWSDLLDANVGARLGGAADGGGGLPRCKVEVWTPVQESSGRPGHRGAALGIDKRRT